MKLTESQIQRAILDWLAWNRILAFRINAGVQYIQSINGSTRAFRGAPAGCPDIIGVAPDGRFMGIEVKAANGKPTQAQLDFIEKINGLGGIAFIARSVEDVEKVLGQEEK